LPERRHAFVAARHEPGGSLGDSECARGAEGSRKLELLAGKLLRGLVLSEREVGESRVGSPREVAGTRDLCAQREPANAQAVREPLVDPSLRNVQATAGNPEHGGSERVALDLTLERCEHLLGRAQLALLEQGAREDAAVEDPKERRSPELRRGERRRRIDLGSGEIAQTKSEPAAQGQPDRERAAVAARARLGDGLVEQRPQLAV